MIEGINVLCHSSIKLTKEKIIYFDPYKINNELHDADIIFITHSHYDHFSEEDIKKIKKEDTIIVAPIDLLERIRNLGFSEENIIIVKPDENYKVGEIEFKTIRAYNTDKPFHPKSNNWLGYLLKIDDITYYIAGDTDITEDNLKVKCDVAFVPIGGTYTMNVKEAATLINKIKPKTALPTHYDLIVGTMKDGNKFAKLLDDEIECKIFMK